ncbi:MAG: SpoIIE family protein phosphatase [Luteolibacter sp.]
MNIEDFSRAIEQGCGAAYRRVFNSPSYEYMGSYIKEITGYDPSEVTPELWDSLILRAEHKGELTGMELEEANRLVRSGQVDRWQADVQIRTRSGETRWVTDMSTVLRDESGQCFGCLGVLLDITERKQAEKELADLASALRQRNEQMEADLAMARKVQLALVNGNAEQFPHSAQAGDARFCFQQRYLPAAMLAGDFVEIIPISDREVGVFIGDVMGHGVRAALLTTFLRGLIEELIPVAADPANLLGKLNNGLRSVFCRSDDFIFATACFLVCDVESGRVVFANAGHSKPLSLHPGTGTLGFMERRSGANEPAIGIVPGFKYSNSEHSLAEGDSLLLYTDGLFEASNTAQHMYGEERMRGFVRDHLDLDSGLLIDRLIADVHKFTASDHFEDDVCLLSITRPLVAN